MVMKTSGEEGDREIQTQAQAMAMANCCVFKCKTCNRKFRSFQALGGHRASHKRPPKSISSSSIKIKAKKKHECSICGKKFKMGQALGGHMRRHRADMINKKYAVPMPMVPLPELLKKSSSKRAQKCLDLNLTPYENDLKLAYQIMSSSQFHPFLMNIYQ